MDGRCEISTFDASYSGVENAFARSSTDLSSDRTKTMDKTDTGIRCLRRCCCIAICPALLLSKRMCQAFFADTSIDLVEYIHFNPRLSTRIGRCRPALLSRSRSKHANRRPQLPRSTSIRGHCVCCHGPSKEEFALSCRSWIPTLHQGQCWESLSWALHCRSLG